MCVAPGPVSAITVHNESVTSTALTLNWTEISLTNSELSHYTVFYLPLRGPYGPIITSNRRERQSAQAGELTRNFTGTTGTLTNLYGAVTYRIQVAAVSTFNGQNITGDRSTAIEMSTLEGSESICTCVYLYCYFLKLISLQYLLIPVIFIILILTLVLHQELHYFGADLIHQMDSSLSTMSVILLIVTIFNFIVIGIVYWYKPKR